MSVTHSQGKPKKIVDDEERLPCLGYTGFRFCFSDVNDIVRIAFSDVKLIHHNRLCIICIIHLCNRRKRVVVCVALAQ